MSATSPAEQTAQPPLEGALSSFVVGQNESGQWVAVETRGLGGGLFRSRKGAIRYALGRTIGRPEAASLTADRIAVRM